MIQDGEITTGEKIVPIEDEVLRRDLGGNKVIIYLQNACIVYQLFAISTYFETPFRNCNVRTK